MIIDVLTLQIPIEYFVELLKHFAKAGSVELNERP
jgi:hypothetical protein